MKRLEKSILPSAYGHFEMLAYGIANSEKMPHIALLHKDYDPEMPIYIRIHSECITGDLFGSKRCDCGEQLRESFNILKEKNGLLIYLRQEGRGIGLINKMKAYNHQDEGMDTIEANIQVGREADERTYGVAEYIIKDLGISKIHLITNNPLKLHAFDKSDIEVISRIPIIINPNEVNHGYLKTKQNDMGHFLSLQ